MRRGVDLLELISDRYPYEFDRLFQYLIEEKHIFSPINNVESLGMDDSDILHWSSLKGSWNLSLQALGVGRTLSKGDYLPHRALSANRFLNDGYRSLVSVEICNDKCSTFGACGYHGGVNCVAGPDVDGSVICNDGWSGSFVEYQCQ
jgi:hypothetical protein